MQTPGVPRQQDSRMQAEPYSQSELTAQPFAPQTSPAQAQTLPADSAASAQRQRSV